MRLHSTMLFVADLPRMAAFYRDVMGLREVAETRTDAWAEFEGGLSLHAIPPHIVAELEPAGAPREDYPVKLIFEAEDVDAAKAALAGAGCAILERSGGWWDAADPEGNILHIRAIDKR